VSAKMSYIKVLVTVALIITLAGIAGYAGYIYLAIKTFSDEVVNIVENVEKRVEVESVSESTAMYKNPEEPKHGYQAAPVVNVKNESYFVSGNDRETLCNQINVEERRVEEDRVQIGYILSSMRYEYYAVLTLKGYTIGDFTVTTDSVITVPQWTSSGGASDDTKNDWRRFKDAVVAHENEHQSILVENATEFVNTLNNLGYYPTETALNVAVEGLYDAAYKQLREEQENFDEEYENEPFQHFCENH